VFCGRNIAINPFCLRRKEKEVSTVQAVSVFVWLDVGRCTLDVHDSVGISNLTEY